MHAAIRLFSKLLNLFACIFTETLPFTCYILILYTNLIYPLTLRVRGIQIRVPKSIERATSGREGEFRA